MAKKKEAEIAPDGAYLLGRNVRAMVRGCRGQLLVLEIDLTKRHGPSKSGKSTLVATTGGNVFVAPGSDVKIGINCYVPMKNGAAE